MPELRRFQNLRKRIVEIMYTLLTKSLQPTNAMVKNLIIIEDSYINTYHPDFMGGANAVLNIFDMKKYSEEKNKSEKNHKDMEKKLNFEDVASDNSVKS